MKKLIWVSLVLFVGYMFAAMGSEEVSVAKQLTDSNINCDRLTEDQLELIGEYYMEQRHPGRAHELMHKMMGLKEGTTEEKQFHISLAKTMYCNQEDQSSRPYGMMGWGIYTTPYNMMNYYNSPNIFGWSILDVLVLILLVGLIVLVYFHIWKKLGETKTKR